MIDADTRFALMRLATKNADLARLAAITGRREEAAGALLAAILLYSEIVKREASGRWL